MSQSGDNSNKTLMIVLAVLGGGLLVCCGVGTGAYFMMKDVAGDFAEGFEEGFDIALDEGMGEFDRQVEVEIENNPVIIEQIGTISEFRSDINLSLAEPGEDDWVFHITGDKGSGMLRAECITIDENTEDVPSAELTLDSGEVFQLFPDNPLN